MTQNNSSDRDNVVLDEPMNPYLMDDDEVVVDNDEVVVDDQLLPNSTSTTLPMQWNNNQENYEPLAQSPIRLQKDRSSSSIPITTPNDENYDPVADDDDTFTIIDLDPFADATLNRQNNTASTSAGLAWILERNSSPELEERRQRILLRELERIQRASFLHFLLLCLIPFTLMLLILVTVLKDEIDCNSIATTCREETRSFMNAFTRRCICDAILAVSSSSN
jgi:hypothetical protein